MAKKYTDEQRDQIMAAARKFLESNGVDVDQLERETAQQRAARGLFSTPLREGVSTRFQTIPEGNQEFRPVGRHGGGKAARCQARSRRSGFKQCGNIAVFGFRVCRFHGAAAHGRKTKEGIKRSAEHLIVHGTETKEIRRMRSQVAKELRQLNLEMVAQGMSAPEIRGPRPGKDGRIDIGRYLKRRKLHELNAPYKAKKLLTIE